MQRKCPLGMRVVIVVEASRAVSSTQLANAALEGQSREPQDRCASGFLGRVRIPASSWDPALAAVAAPSRGDAGAPQPHVK